ncbi:MAG TPA: hypothetical protein VM307_11570, partial [Egibacteraceae bacterium]|nr:hypothetical protein [Egibacteraceae bacterium]
TTPAPDPEPTTAEDPDGQPPAVEVPDLVGVTLSQAVRDLLVASGIDKADLPSAVGNVATVEDADDLLAVHCTGLHCGDVEFEERITADAQQGTVLAQSQTAGAAWKLGKVLTLTVAVGPVEPPAEEMPEPTPEEPTEAPGEDAIEERAS